MTENGLSANFPVPGSVSTSELRTGGSVEAGAANEAVADGRQRLTVYELDEIAAAIDSRIVEAARNAGLEPADVEELLEGEWGWETHDTGYGEAVHKAVAWLIDAAAHHLKIRRL